MKRGKGPDPSKPKSPDRRELDRIEAREKDGRKPAIAPPLKQGPGFAELGVMSNYSFLHGASHPSDLVGRAIELGLQAIGIADRNSVAGVVRAYVALRDAPGKARDAMIKAKKERGESVELTAQEEAACHTDLRLVMGARLVFVDGTPDILAYPKSRLGWGRLTRLLTKGNMEAVKGDCILTFSDLIDHLDDLLLIILPLSTARPQEAHKAPPAYPSGDEAVSISHLKLVPPAAPPTWQDALRRLQNTAPGRVWLGLTLRHHGRDRRHAAAIQKIAGEVGVSVIATNDVLYAEASSRPLQDVLSCVRDGVTLKQAGRRLEAHAERHIKPPLEMARLYADCPQALAETIRFVDQIDFVLTDLKYEYPHEPVPPGWSPDGWLENLVRRRAKGRYGRRLPPKVRALIGQELRLIRRQNYAYYFLTVHDLVRFARAQKPPILCQGRGSAANSIVCFLLGVTSVDPMKHDLLFSRFVSEERNEPPDIDVDFEHERREEVMQYIYRRYGRERAGIAATVIHYRSRSALREVTKVLGLSEDIAARLSSTVWGSYSRDLGDGRFIDAGFSLDNVEIVRLRSLVEQLIRAPFARHLSQHVGGFVLTQNRLDETVPIHNAAMPDRSFIEWDKDDIDALGLMKVDVLALGMLSCIRRAYELMRRHGLGDYDLTVDLDSEDPAVYAMLQKGDSIGVFQVESRAQINMLPRLKPENLYDLTVQVAIVRPGPIEGDMVHPYLRRRAGLEKAEFPSPSPPHNPNELRELLKDTYGVPLFQEQAMKLAIVAAEFTPSEANQLRRSMATFRQVGGMDKFKEKMIGGMVRRGYERDFAERCYSQIEGFGSYGFPESHALSFARLVYVSAWIKCHQPAVFACALLNSQPMGFYAPAQIVRDAREHGVAVHDVDVNMSGWDNALEPLLRSRNRRRGEGEGRALALRLGFRQIDGFRETWAAQMVEARAQGLFTSLEDLARRAGLPARALRLLADADACRSLGQDRRAALWEARRTPSNELPLFAAARKRDQKAAGELGQEPDAMLPAMPLAEQVAADYQMTRLSLKGHPMQFLRPVFAAEGVLSCAQTSAAKNGTKVRTAGVVLVRQRPGKGNAVFITIEDETGITNILLWARLFEMQRRPVMASRLMLVEGEVQRSKEGVVHLMATRVHDRTAEMSRLSDTHKPHIALSRADEFLHPQHPRTSSHPRNVRILPKSRDFH
ncbi:DNA polymerase III subunit alpha [Sphingomonadales bacterium 56]|uniref:error-prone DNA polymerase n=1 Tax=unclassified Sphingobium TaxID=2611147 RepID=UPI0019191463|nr:MULTISPECIES: error-prone DNA polymerase [unclassified Sphingobium]MBY2928836.1 DNA polymerase III subunit alpha [Sphingomonadales bacterium 56]MBY2959312.1 DNA polymerase III subunit alpha [Sphingomonadales bacterium 58]CAD7338127.1 Error-prone DNA polymerase [Sphingobium sp. S6]CAD7338793.1 Error-prone DNA polymerase [Sphingobium sp. S8]